MFFDEDISFIFRQQEVGQCWKEVLVEWGFTVYWGNSYCTCTWNCFDELTVEGRTSGVTRTNGCVNGAAQCTVHSTTVQALSRKSQKKAEKYPPCLVSLMIIPTPT